MWGSGPILVLPVYAHRFIRQTEQPTNTDITKPQQLKRSLDYRPDTPEQGRPEGDASNRQEVEDGNHRCLECERHERPQEETGPAGDNQGGQARRGNVQRDPPHGALHLPGLLQPLDSDYQKGWLRLIRQHPPAQEGEGAWELPAVD